MPDALPSSRGDTHGWASVWGLRRMSPEGSTRWRWTKTLPHRVPISTWLLVAMMLRARVASRDGEALKGDWKLG